MSARLSAARSSSSCASSRCSASRSGCCSQEMKSPRTSGTSCAFSPRPTRAGRSAAGLVQLDAARAQFREQLGVDEVVSHAEAAFGELIDQARRRDRSPRRFGLRATALACLHGLASSWQRVSAFFFGAGFEHGAAALRRAAAAGVDLVDVRRIVLVAADLVVVAQLFAGRDGAHGVDEHAAVLDDRGAVAVAVVIDEARVAAVRRPHRSRCCGRR